MSYFKGSMIGLSKILNRMGKMTDDMRPAMDQALVVCAQRVQRTAKRSIQNSPEDPRTGRSVPGNAPKTDTGRLVNSIFVQLEDAADHSFVLVGTNVKYGRYLEFGTKLIQPRPWLIPAMEENRTENLKTITTAFRDVMEKKST